MVQSQADVSHEEIDTDKSSEGSKSEQNQGRVARPLA